METNGREQLKEILAISLPLVMLIYFGTMVYKMHFK
jgi:hypothetical protein